MARQPAFEEIEHTADLALLIRGATLPELFSNAARALFLQISELPPAAPIVTRRVRVSAIDLESLLVAWLNQLLFLSETRHEVYHEFTIHSFSALALRATVKGGTSAGPVRQIKGATYHDLVIREGSEGFQATVVLDV